MSEPDRDAIAVVSVVVGRPPRVRIKYAEPNARWTQTIHASPEAAMAELSAWCHEAFSAGVTRLR